MQVVLIMLSNGGERRSFSVVRSTTTVGRREDCDLRIPVGDVSRKHCRLVLTDDNLRIQDLGSSNGTFVNGQQVQDAFVNAGDTLSVGPVNFVVQIDGVPDESQFDAPTVAVTDTAAGGTALALHALESAEAPEPELAATDELLEEVAPEADPAELEPVAEEGVTRDEVPVEDVASALDRIELDEAPPAEEPVPAAAADEWDFLIEEPKTEGSHVDLHVDLDQPHDHK